MAAELSALKGLDFLSSADLNGAQTQALLTLAADIKAGRRTPRLDGKVLGLIFSKASTRTRVSFTVAMARLGGQTIDLNPSVSQVGRGEPIEDTARVLSRYLNALAIRTFAQSDLQAYADAASIPIINALTDLEHPCQALADYLTMQEAFGSLEGLTMTYVGDGNNVAHSLLIAGALLGVNVRIGCPAGFYPLNEVVAQAKAIAAGRSEIVISEDPAEAVRGAHAVYTDVWASMGQEDEQAEREAAFAAFCVDQDLMDQAAKDAIVLHCLPAHRGEEITPDVMEGASSRIFDQAENRLHAQQALLAALMGGL